MIDSDDEEASAGDRGREEEKSRQPTNPLPWSQVSLKLKEF